ncbi:MAG: DUF2256 and DUF3253 domain-containing protein [Planctomycetota bacterium]
MTSRATKSCVVCGREIEWRKKWERDWDSVRYCSKACRKKKLSPTDEALEEAIETLLDRRGAGKSICPSEAAKLVSADEWRDLMEPARMAGRRLVDRGDVVFTQQGHTVDPSTARGPIRIQRPR